MCEINGKKLSREGTLLGVALCRMYVTTFQI